MLPDMQTLPQRTSGTRRAALSMARIGVAVEVVSMLAASALASDTAARETMAPRALRGYGTLSARFERHDDDTSHLRIQCEDAGKAAIVHAKYAADLRLLLAVKETPLALEDTVFRATTVPGQGLVVTFRRDDVVHAVAGKEGSAVKAVLQTLRSEWASAELVPSGTVPMYLDAWDRHGFRFYYWPFHMPDPKPGEARVHWKDYDVLGEFEFAQRCDASGLVLWMSEDRTDFAEGLNNRVLWDWAARAAARRRLPVVVNSNIASGVPLLNRYRNETQRRAPGYCGGYYTAGDSFHAGYGRLSWCSAVGRDAWLSILQGGLRHFAAQPNTIEYLEPHAELRHGEHDILTEYGPLADASYRAYLEQRYGSVKTVSRRWFGDTSLLRSWGDVRVPELAHFLGFDDASLDLAGNWRIRYEESSEGKVQPAPEEWYRPEFADDDWPEVAAPHTDLAMFLPRRPVVWRRHFTVSGDWLRERKRTWLYLFSLNRARKEAAPVWLNGKKVAEPTVDRIRHWTAAEVTDVLQPGENLLAVKLPENFLGYRVYLSDHEPAHYPYLGEGMNAQWADFIRWQARTRRDACRRGLESIRQVDANRSIVCMAPDAFVSGLKTLCEDYGGHFHNTGYMSGWWAEPLPMLMRSADMPFSLEPGGPAANLQDFKLFLGNWLTEGVNAVHYFIHIGNVYWNDEIRPYFEEMQPVIGAIGKMHVPKAEVAMLLGDDVANLTGYPWKPDERTIPPCGYVPFQFNLGLRDEYHMDAVTPPDFARGTVEPYRVVIDTGTSVMDPETVGDIETWVRRGGVFVTSGHTGRHTPEKADAWPIGRLTGYRAKRITFHPEYGKMTFAAGQDVFEPEAWDEGQLRRTGLILEKVDNTCRDLLQWPDGSTAVGLRRVGKGMAIHVGCHYNNHPLLFRQILAWLKIKRIRATCGASSLKWTHAVSNNGLYDTWILWNQDRSKATKADFAFRDGLRPAFCVDLKTQEKLPLTPTADGARLAGLSFAPLHVRVLVTPRERVADAPWDWLKLQRGWWRGTAKPSRLLPPYEPRHTLDLTEDWRVKWLAEDDRADMTPLAAPDLDDAGWPQARLGNWIVPDEQPSRRAFFRRRFTVPPHWVNGEIELRILSWHRQAVRGRLRAWLDGLKLQDEGSCVNGLTLTGELSPGSRHVLAVEVSSEGQVAGAIGNSWLYFRPQPAAGLDLAGEWVTTQDGLAWSGRASLPGPWDAFMARRTVHVADSRRGMAAVVQVATAQPCGIYGVMINGRWVMRLHHDVGRLTELNVTPWIRFGGENEVCIVRRGGPGKGRVEAVRLDFHAAGTYP